MKRASGEKIHLQFDSIFACVCVCLNKDFKIKLF